MLSYKPTIQAVQGKPRCLARVEAWVSAGSEQEFLVLFYASFHLPYSAFHVSFLFTDFLQTLWKWSNHFWSTIIFTLTLNE